MIKPVIISASRSTDIPCHHAEWFMNRLRAGGCQWRNPFNQQISEVSFEDVRAICFWSKFPVPLYKYLREIDDMGINYYFQYTLNDYDNEGFEPNIPSLQTRVNAFKHLSDIVGPGRVIWRYDPILLTDKVQVEGHLKKMRNIFRELSGYTQKMVFSFADVERYRKVQFNLNSAGLKWREADQKNMIELGTVAGAVGKYYGIEVATCAENIDLSPYGVGHNRCIDPELLVREFGKDKALMNWLGFDIYASQWKSVNRITHDTGQRKACGCIASKDIGAYTTCGNACVYCYANTTPRLGIQGCVEAHKNKNRPILV